MTKLFRPCSSILMPNLVLWMGSSLFFFCLRFGRFLVSSSFHDVGFASHWEAPELVLSVKTYQHYICSKKSQISIVVVGLLGKQHNCSIVLQTTVFFLEKNNQPVFPRYSVLHQLDKISNLKMWLWAWKCHLGDITHSFVMFYRPNNSLIMGIIIIYGPTVVHTCFRAKA